MIILAADMTQAQIFAVSRHRLVIDGEGVTTLVTFNGCPLRCKYCLNKTSWDAAKGRFYTPEELYEIVKIDQLYFLATKGGVTFGGGEPLLQVDFIRGISCFVRTAMEHRGGNQPQCARRKRDNG